ncbi:hypothetical protein BaRGS_00002806 [Batillaria attramentaria]|uniref:Uncharacterized protein n=1 Tax=Batillaria attramentaria TaxID=370345 RepID=A0ABD0M2P8_9CAEN
MPGLFSVVPPQCAVCEHCEALCTTNRIEEEVSVVKLPTTFSVYESGLSTRSKLSLVDSHFSSTTTPSCGLDVDEAGRGGGARSIVACSSSVEVLRLDIVVCVISTLVTVFRSISFVGYYTDVGWGPAGSLPPLQDVPRSRRSLWHA